MDKVIAIFCSFTAIAVIVLAFPEGNLAILVTGVLAALTIVLIRQNTEENTFLIRIFLL